MTKHNLCCCVVVILFVFVLRCLIYLALLLLCLMFDFFSAVLSSLVMRATSVFSIVVHWCYVGVRHCFDISESEFVW